MAAKATRRLASLVGAQAKPLKATLHFSYTVHVEPSAGATVNSTARRNQKVVLHVNVDEFGLTPPQVARLAAVAGPRLCPETNTLKLVSRIYEDMEHNKAALKQQLGLLLDDAVATPAFLNAVGMAAEDSEVGRTHAH